MSELTPTQIAQLNALAKLKAPVISAAQAEYDARQKAIQAKLNSSVGNSAYQNALLKIAKEKAGIASTTPVPIPAIPAASVNTKFGANAAKLQALLAKIAIPDIAAPDSSVPQNNIAIDKYGHTITYNARQQEFIALASANKDCILVGAAGTGKTTCMRGAIAALMQSSHIPILQNDGHKYLKSDTPGIVVVAFTKRAVGNIRKALTTDMQANCLTVHKLLEYEPMYYTVTDTATGEERNTMRFEPTRHEYRKLPSTIKCCVIEESSMLNVDLFDKLKAALPTDCTFIFLGDIQQLPPVFGSAILGYKMLTLPVIELTEVYRQALESPIIRLAHRVLSGLPIPAKEFPEWKYPGQLTIHPWKKKLSDENALLTLAKFFTVAYDAKSYNPEEDSIIMPFNKSCGTIELNKHIANHIARVTKSAVYEIIAGFNKYYIREGERVLVDKESGIILKIEKNLTYTGAAPQAESASLDYWGYNDGSEHEHHITEDNNDIDFMLNQMAATGGDGEDRVRKASHKLTIYLTDSEREVILDTAADLNDMLLDYAKTVHKMQGCEARKVFLLFHQSHATMIYRELLYTGITRAREELYIICEPDTFEKGIKTQRIKGDTLAAKAEFFKGKQERLL